MFEIELEGWNGSAKEWVGQLSLVRRGDRAAFTFPWGAVMCRGGVAPKLEGVPTGTYKGVLVIRNGQDLETWYGRDWVSISGDIRASQIFARYGVRIRLMSGGVALHGGTARLQNSDGSWLGEAPIGKDGWVSIKDIPNAKFSVKDHAGFEYGEIESARVDLIRETLLHRQ